MNQVRLILVVQPQSGTRRDADGFSHDPCTADPKPQGLRPLRPDDAAEMVNGGVFEIAPHFHMPGADPVCIAL